MKKKYLLFGNLQVDIFFRDTCAFFFFFFSEGF